jgi:hypothetical protein
VRDPDRLTFPLLSQRNMSSNKRLRTRSSPDRRAPKKLSDLPPLTDHLSIFFFCSEEFDFMPMLSLVEEENKTRASSIALQSLIDDFDIAFNQVLQDHLATQDIRVYEDTVKFCTSVFKDTLGSFRVVVKWESGSATDETLSDMVGFASQLSEFVKWVRSGCSSSRSIQCSATSNTLWRWQ